MDIDEQTKELIQQRVEQIRRGEAKRFLLQNVLYSGQQRERDKKAIEEEIAKIEPVYNKFQNHIKTLKSLVPDITEQSVICAVYLIYGKICHTWEASFMLAKNGFNFELMELARSINESLDLIKVFHLDKSGKHLSEWFEGKIIENKIARQLEHEFLIAGSIPAIKNHDLSPYEMSTTVYRGISKYTHCSYVALLDSVDVYNHNFDWNKYGGYHYARRNCRWLADAMVSTLITLKMTYSELKDMGNYQKIDQLMIEFAGPQDEATLMDLIPKIK